MNGRFKMVSSRNSGFSIYSMYSLNFVQTNSQGSSSISISITALYVRVHDANAPDLLFCRHAVPRS